MSFNDLGIKNNVKVYGYSLFPLDIPVSATSADLTNYKDTTFFPHNTSSNTSLGGLDLLANTGIFHVPAPILRPPTASQPEEKDCFQLLNYHLKK